MAKSQKKPAIQKQKTTKSAQSSTARHWIAENYKTISYSILGLALFLRLWLLIDLPNLPFSDMHKHKDLDMGFFDAWGERIADGDVFTDTTWHPYHNWHAEAAKQLGLDEAGGRAKWNEWYGGIQYHQEPLYPLIIGFSKMFGGNGHWLLFLLQMVASVFSVWMIMWLGRHYFGDIAGLAGGLLYTLYCPGLLFDVVILRTSFATCHTLAILFVAEKLMKGESKPWIFGVIGGLGYIFQTTSLLFWIPLLIRWLYARRNDIKRSWQMVLGFAVVVSFLVIRNTTVGAPAMSASSVGPVTFALSNFPKYQPELGFVYFVQIGKVLEEVKGSMIGAASMVIGKHDSFFDWIMLEFKKLALVFHWYEVPNNINSYLAQKFSLPLKIAFIPWSLIGALGIVAMILNFRNKKSINLLIGILSQVAVMVAFYVLCRFRVPMVALMAIYAGFVIQQDIEYYPGKRAWLLIGGSLVAFIFMTRNIPKIDVRFPSGEMAVYWHTYYLDRLNALNNKGDLRSCIYLLEDFISSKPGFLRNLDRNIPLESQNEKELARYYGKLHGDLGDFYRDVGNQSLADRNYKEMDRLTAAGQ